MSFSHWQISCIKVMICSTEELGIYFLKKEQFKNQLLLFVAIAAFLQHKHLLLVPNIRTSQITGLQGSLVTQLL